jgi:hypothetical protein
LSTHFCDSTLDEVPSGTAVTTAALAIAHARAHAKPEETLGTYLQQAPSAARDALIRGTIATYTGNAQEAEYKAWLGTQSPATVAELDRFAKARG